MAWMFAGTENDMSVGLHLHYHYLPPFMPPTPFYPHPAIGIARDKFASKTKVNNRKAARTGTKFKVLIPPHLPWIGPLTHGVGKENTGIQTGWMGAGIGMHPFGGIGFVVIEGKPAIGMLSNLLGCWCVAPGFDMMLPFLGLDFLMIPTHAPTVLYGPAPLAMDLFVLLLAMIEAVLDFLISKIPIPILQEIAEVGKNAILEGTETAMTAWESGVRPVSAALAQGATAAGHAFVSGMVEFAVEKVTGPIGNIPVVGDTLQGAASDWAQGQVNDRIGQQVPGYSEYLTQREADAAASGPTPGGVFGAIDSIGTGLGEGANASAVAAHPGGDPNAPILHNPTQAQLDAGHAAGTPIIADAFQGAVEDHARGQVADQVAGGLTPEGQEPGLGAKLVGDVVGAGAVPARGGGNDNDGDALVHGAAQDAAGAAQRDADAATTAANRPGATPDQQAAAQDARDAADGARQVADQPAGQIDVLELDDAQEDAGRAHDARQRAEGN